MMLRKVASQPGGSRQNQGDKLKDEVYRQMFRLEANRPGADLALAIALLRGWLASNSEPEAAQLLEWLRKICPICLVMIEAERPRNGAGQPFIQ
jgi:hypothetical protein